MTLRVIKGICALYPPPKGGGLTAQKVKEKMQIGISEVISHSQKKSRKVLFQHTTTIDL